MAGKQASVIPTSRLGRAVWLTVTVLVLSLLAVAIWVWAHTDAAHMPRTPHHAGGALPRIEEETTTAPMAEEMRVSTDLVEVYSSPFCPQKETDFESEKGVVTEEKTETEDKSFAKDELIYHGRPNERMEIALSFDDGPHPRYTPIILDILAEYGIKATFFMVGENVKYYSAAAEAVVAAGHEIGNHTFSHRKFNLMNEHEMLSEIAGCEEAVASVSEQKLQFIRPPEGHLSDTMRRVVGELDYQIVLWDVDTRDWAHTPPDVITQHVLDTVQAGDIILMHDFIGHNSPTPEALRRLIPALLERGYHFVTVGELVNGAE